MREPAVFVVAVTDADEVVLVDLYRYATGQQSLEVPAGGTDGEDPLTAARRELREETGLAAAHWRHLGRMQALNGVVDAPEDVFLATGLTDVGGDARAEEGIDGVRRLPFAEVLALVADVRITDSETVTALALAGIALGRFR
jgi:8-oxo-dGTP pyrophosphatase MutT (NUDIX family)